MAESTCLHIQDRESGPIRVVELPWISVRIGRAAFCEVRLPDQELAAETCRLTRRGRTWSLSPVGDEGLVELDGRTIKSPCPLPFGVPFRVGSHWLTLRQDLGVEPDWDIYPATPPPGLSPTLAPSPLKDEVRPEYEHDRNASVAAADPEPAEPVSRVSRDRTRWEARWKAAEAHLKSRAEGFQTGVERKRGPNPSTFDPMPSRERPEVVARPAPPGATPLIDPAARPIPTPRTPRIEPGWTAPQTEPPAVSSRVDPALKPSPIPVVDRFEPGWTDARGHSHSPPLAPEPWVVQAPSRTEPPSLDRRAATAEAENHGDDIVGPSGSVEELHADGLEAASPAPIPCGSTGDSAPSVAGECLESIAVAHPFAPEGPSGSDERQLDDTPVEESSGRMEQDSDPGPSTSWSHGAVEEECPVPPEVMPAREPAAVDRPAPGVEGQEIESESRRSRRGDDRRAATPDEDPSESLREHRGGAVKPVSPVWEPFGGTSGLSGREPKKRRGGRDRIGSERRGKVPRGTRPGDRASGSESNRVGTAQPPEEVIWPSVKDILPNHGVGLGPMPAVSRARKGQQPLPTVPCEPGQWLLPVWIAWPPLAVTVLVIGLGAGALSWIWSMDSSSAAFVTQRLLRPDASSRRRPLPDWVVEPDGRWLTTTSQHVAHWAVFLDDSEDDGKRDGSRVSAMLERSLQISPLNPTARLALARLESPTVTGEKESVRSLGLSRDAVSLAWSARRLLDSGKKEAAIRLYGQALSAASTGGFSRTVTPRYDDDENARRYLLPGEDAVRDIVAEMDQRDWSFREWSMALPKNPTVLLATARMLRERNRIEEAKPLLALILEGGAQPTREGPDSRAVAARAEALALGSRLKEAEQEYRQAIELADNDMIRRSWWFNLADVALRLNDETQRRLAIRAAMVEPSDEITRRASSIRRASDSRSREPYGSTRAN
ncbi:MAG: hypothetical protein ACLQGP_36950 [Isosphaeraceae bacterium]